MIKINNLLQIDEDLTALLKFVYLRGSRTALGQVGFTARNIHTRRIRTSITGNAGIQFIPSTFELDPGQVRTVLLNVADVAFLETLPVGTTAVDFRIAASEILPPVILLPEPIIPGIPPAPAIILGCLDPSATNYNSSANMSDGSCNYAPTLPPRIRGCIDRNAVNFNPYASDDDGTCRYQDTVQPVAPPIPVYGCTDAGATNYNPTATVNTGCIYPAKRAGCTNSRALNYNALAEIDDGSCVLSGRWILAQIANSYQTSKTVITQTSQENVQQATADNNYTAGYYTTDYGYSETTYFGPQYEYQLEGDAKTAGARPSNPSREISVERGTVGIITNRFLRPLDPVFVVCNEIGKITREFSYPVGTQNQGYKNVCRLIQNAASPGGCTENCMDEFVGVYGCTDPNAANYNPSATLNDGTCIAKPAEMCGTTTSNTLCANVLGNGWTGTAIRTLNVLTGNCRPNPVLNEDWDVSGCTKITISPPITGCTNAAAVNYNPNAVVDDGSCVFAPKQIRGCMNPSAVNYNPDAEIDDGSCTFYTSGGGGGGGSGGGTYYGGNDGNTIYTVGGNTDQQI